MTNPFLARVVMNSDSYGAKKGDILDIDADDALELEGLGVVTILGEDAFSPEELSSEI
jgi:hypothetical protein